jgi:DnaJ-related protein SCJ1
MKHSFNWFFLFLSFISIVIAGEDYYKILGVDKNADEKEIRNAYRQLSKKYHPDKNPGDESAQHKFMEISNAYDILMDSEKRQIYDRYGEEGLKNGGQGGGRQRGGDPFSNFFNQQFRQGPPRAQDVNSELEFTLADFYNGKNIDFQISLMDVCDSCKGTGSSDGLKHECSDCRGNGRILQRRNLGHGMIQQMEVICPKCRGSGKEIKHKCKSCQGQGAYSQQKHFNLHLTPGSPRNHVEKFEGKGPTQPGVVAGDLNVILKENKDENLGYRRVGKNLYRTEVLSLKEAFGGNWTRDIPFFDSYDPKITLSRAQGKSIQNGEVEIIKGKGMPVFHGNDEFGDLFIEYVIVFPLGNQKVLENLHDEL